MIFDMIGIDPSDADILENMILYHLGIYLDEHPDSEVTVTRDQIVDLVCAVFELGKG